MDSKEDASRDLDAGTAVDDLELLTWHLARYDHLRSSTANRALAVLAAGAILSTGNAVILAQLLIGFDTPIGTWLLALFSAAVVVSTTLVVMSLFRASNVLVTRRASRQMLAGGSSFPRALIFNGTDTVEHISDFAEFQTICRDQTRDSIVTAAQVELWITIQQHRHRYVQLRASVRTLRYAGMAFLLILIGVIAANLVTQL